MIGDRLLAWLIGDDEVIRRYLRRSFDAERKYLGTKRWLRLLNWRFR